MAVNLHNPAQYYNSILSSKQKPVYKAILNGVRKFEQDIKLPSTPVPVVSMIWNYVLLDNPLIFYVSAYKYFSAGYLLSLRKKVKAIRPVYNMNKQAARQNFNKITEYMRQFDSLVNKSEFEKELAIHDHCLANFKYDFSCGSNSQSILGPILHKTAVCAGIAKFAKLAFDYVGIKSLVVSGKAKNPVQGMNENHVWNIVKISGKIYHLDVTFDLSLTDKLYRYDYFNISDDDIKKDHIILSHVPACDTDGIKYFPLRFLFANNLDEFENQISDCLKKGQNTVIIKLGLIYNGMNIENVIMEIARRQYAGIYKQSFEIKMRSNMSQMVFEIHFIPGGS